MSENIIDSQDLEGWGDIGKEYIKKTQEIFEKNLNYEIENSNLNHAMFLSFLLIKKAKETIRIFTTKMNETFFENLRIKEEFEKAIRRGVEIHILLQEGSEDKFLKFKEKEGITIHKLKEKSNINNHFLLSDNSAFRIEEPHTQKDLKEKRIKGFANFNDPILVGKIVNLYDERMLRNSQIVN